MGGSSPRVLNSTVDAADPANDQRSKADGRVGEWTSDSCVGLDHYSRGLGRQLRLDRHMVFVRRCLQWKRSAEDLSQRGRDFPTEVITMEQPLARYLQDAIAAEKSFETQLRDFAE